MTTKSQTPGVGAPQPHDRAVTASLGDVSPCRPVFVTPGVGNLFLKHSPRAGNQPIKPDLGVLDPISVSVARPPRKPLVPFRGNVCSVRNVASALG